jgi:hypothetical protein
MEKFELKIIKECKETLRIVEERLLNIMNNDNKDPDQLTNSVSLIDDAANYLDELL